MVVAIVQHPALNPLKTKRHAYLVMRYPNRTEYLVRSPFSAITARILSERSKGNLVVYKGDILPLEVSPEIVESGETFKMSSGDVSFDIPIYLELFIRPCVKFVEADFFQNPLLIIINQVCSVLLSKDQTGPAVDILRRTATLTRYGII